MREELARVDSGLPRPSFNLVHVNMLNTMTALHEQVHELRGEVSALRAQLEAGSALQRSLRSDGLPAEARPAPPAGALSERHCDERRAGRGRTHDRPAFVSLLRQRPHDI